MIGKEHRRGTSSRGTTSSMLRGIGGRGRFLKCDGRLDC